MVGAALAALVIASSKAVAIPVDYTFDVSFNGSGTVPVSVTLDGVTETGVEIFRPAFGNLLAFDFTFSGQSFSASDASTFTATPLIGLENGQLAEIVYMGRKTILGGRISYSANIELDDQTNSTAYVVVAPGQFNFSRGEVAPQTWTRVSAPVSAPATIALFGLGLAGLGLERARRKACCS